MGFLSKFAAGLYYTRVGSPPKNTPRPCTTCLGFLHLTDSPFACYNIFVTTQLFTPEQRHDEGSAPGRPRLEGGVGPLIGLRVFLGPQIWRIAPVWAMLAGALTARVPLWEGATPLRLIGAAVLADSLWGLLWRLTATDAGALSAEPATVSLVPYYQARSPAGGALRLIRHMIAGGSWHELFVALASAALLSLLLGLPALVLTIIAWATMGWAWLLVQSGRRPAACDALLNVGWPWLLGWSVLAFSPSLLAPLPSSPLALSPMFGEGLGWGLGPGWELGLAFTLLQWGARRADLLNGRRMAAIWLGQASVLAVLIGRQQIAALALSVLLLLPSWWHLCRAARDETDLKDALARSHPWWLTAMLLSAFLLR